MTWVTYKRKYNTSPDPRETGETLYYDIHFHSEELVALRFMAKNGGSVAEIPTSPGSWSFNWVVSENAKDIPAWRRNSD